MTEQVKHHATLHKVDSKTKAYTWKCSCGSSMWGIVGESKTEAEKQRRKHIRDPYDQRGWTHDGGN